MTVASALTALVAIVRQCEDDYRRVGDIYPWTAEDLFAALADLDAAAVVEDSDD